MTLAHLDASRASAAVRSRTAATLQAIADGDLAIVDVLLAETAAADEALGTIARVRVERLLRAVVGVGEVTATRVCRSAGIERVTRIEALSAPRRRQLADAIRALDLASYSGTGPRRRAA